MSIITEIDKKLNRIETRIIDKSSNFELITSGGFSIAQGIESEFGESFENFIKH